MRAALVFLVAAACGRGDEGTPAKVTPAEITRTPGPPPATPFAPARAAVVDSTPFIGPVAPAPPAPTPGRLDARSCKAATPAEIGEAEASGRFAAAFGRARGLVAWAPAARRLATRPIGRDGAPLGPAHEVDVPAPLDRTFGLRALDGHYLAFMSETDYSGASPIYQLFAAVFDLDGRLVGGPLKIDIGQRGLIDGISHAAAHGVLIYAGSTPATDVADARLVTLHVGADGKPSQSVRDFPEPLPGDRANPFFSIGDEHTALVAGPSVIVDGEPRTIRDDGEAPDGLVVAPSFQGDSVPIIGMSLRDLIQSRAKLHYGELALDGVRTYERKGAPESAPLRPPFENSVRWSIGSDTSGGAVTATPSPRFGSYGATVSLTGALPGISSGIFTAVVWTGEQALVVYTAGTAVRIAPLPCN